MRPINIEPTGMTRVTEKVTAIAPARPANPVADGEQDIEVTRRSLATAQQAPVDSERVEQIRKAISSGNYPLVPAKIADAMIAAKLILRKPQ